MKIFEKSADGMVMLVEVCDDGPVDIMDQAPEMAPEDEPALSALANATRDHRDRGVDVRETPCRSVKS